MSTVAIDHEYKVGDSPDSLPNEDFQESDWRGPWEFDAESLTWSRPYQDRHFQTSKLTDIQLNHAVGFRPGVLRDVVHLNVPLVALHSHPESPKALPEDKEGAWIDTNPAWPGQTVYYVLRQMSLRPAWKDTPEAPNDQEHIKVGEKVLSALVVYVRPEDAS